MSLICSNTFSSTGAEGEVAAGRLDPFVTLAIVLMGNAVSSILRLFEAGSRVEFRRSAT
jgi:hypothetical protein